jgi:hypothetical protein
MECLLEEIPPGCTVIMDNASFHRQKQLRKMASGRVRLLFLPPFSPDYNPIEKTWANMKHDLRNKRYNTAGQALLPLPVAAFRGKPRGIKPFGSSLARSCACKHARDLAPFVNKGQPTQCVG